MSETPLPPGAKLEITRIPLKGDEKDASDGAEVVIEQVFLDPDKTERHTTGTQIWQCSHELIAQLDNPILLNACFSSPSDSSDEQQSWKGKKVLEVGAGAGALAVVLASKGAHVTASDLSYVLELADKNISKNSSLIEGAGGSCKTAEIDWEKPLSEEILGEKFDLVLCCDILYHAACPPNTIDKLVNLLDNLVKDERAATPILHAHTPRVFTEPEFFEQMEENGFSCLRLKTEGGEDILQKQARAHVVRRK